MYISYPFPNSVPRFFYIDYSDDSNCDIPIIAINSSYFHSLISFPCNGATWVRQIRNMQVRFVRFEGQLIWRIRLWILHKATNRKEAVICRESVGFSSQRPRPFVLVHVYSSVLIIFPCLHRLGTVTLSLHRLTSLDQKALRLLQIT